MVEGESTDINSCTMEGMVWLWLAYRDKQAGPCFNRFVGGGFVCLLSCMAELLVILREKIAIKKIFK